MVKEKRLMKIFPKPPMVAYQQHPNLKSMLIRAKITSGNGHRTQNGMMKCDKQCKVCSFIIAKILNFEKFPSVIF